MRAGFVGLWAQMNYAQMTALFRVEERPVSFAIASVANVLITIGSTIALVIGAHKGAIGAVVGNFLGTLSCTPSCSATAATSSASSSTGGCCAR